MSVAFRAQAEGIAMICQSFHILEECDFGMRPQWLFVTTHPHVQQSKRMRLRCGDNHTLSYINTQMKTQISVLQNLVCSSPPKTHLL